MSSKSALFGSIVPDPDSLKPQLLFFLQRAGGLWVPAGNGGDAPEAAIFDASVLGNDEHDSFIVAFDGNVDPFLQVSRSLVSVGGVPDHSCCLWYCLQDDDRTVELEFVSDRAAVKPAQVVHLVLAEINGSVALNDQEASAEALCEEQNLLNALSEHLADDAILLCYGCSVANLSLVQQFSEKLGNFPIHSLRLPPVLMAFEQESLVFTLSDAPVSVTRSALILSPESGSVAGASIRIAEGYLKGEDELVFLPELSGPENEILINGTFDREEGVLQLKGPASAAVFSDALKRVYFHSASHDPSASSRVIEITLTDNGVKSNSMTRCVDIQAYRQYPDSTDWRQPPRPDAFSLSLLELEELAPASGPVSGRSTFTIIEPAYGYDVLRLGNSVFSFTLDDVERGYISLVQEGDSVAAGNIYLEIDSGIDGVFGIVVAVGSDDF